jgi:hypothetical protein
MSFILLICIGASCRRDTPQDDSVDTKTNINSAVSTNAVDAESVRAPVESPVVVPVEGYATHRTFKVFGEYISDRFSGYHVGDDVEVDDVNREVPVYAIADGSVVIAQTASGYGGVIIIEHSIEGATYRALYGHVDLASMSLRAGSAVKRGEQIALLGDHESAETDGERKHLHFSIYQGDDIRLAGYANTEDAVDQWVNPQNFFSAYGVELAPSRRYSPATDLGGDMFHIAFDIPEGMEVEYIPQLEALNIFTLAGVGSARERSQLLIRYFDASQFLTLSTVDVLQTADRIVGEGYTAKEYLIQKKSGVADFANQPTWRNRKHTVTDFRASDGQTRYYVVAANPELDNDTYQRVLASMRIE